MEFEGTVYKIMPVTKGTSARGEWQRQDVVFDANEGSFTRKICVTFFNKPDEVAKLREGAAYTVSVNIESREYNGRWYTTCAPGGFSPRLRRHPRCRPCPTCRRLPKSPPTPRPRHPKWMTSPSEPQRICSAPQPTHDEKAPTKPASRGFFVGSGRHRRPPAAHPPHRSTSPQCLPQATFRTVRPIPKSLRNFLPTVRPPAKKGRPLTGATLVFLRNRQRVPDLHPSVISSLRLRASHPS